MSDTRNPATTGDTTEPEGETAAPAATSDQPETATGDPEPAGATGPEAQPDTDEAPDCDVPESREAELEAEIARLKDLLLRAVAEQENPAQARRT